MGSERKGEDKQEGVFSVVAIPRGGLGTGFSGQVDSDGFHVTIPHSGLGTLNGVKETEAIKKVSPSHTVGL